MRRSPDGLLGRVLRSLLRGGVLYLALFLVTHVLLATTSGGFRPVDLLVLALVSAPQAVLVIRRRLDLPLLWTAVLCALLTAAALVGVGSITTANWNDEYAFWFFGAIAFSLLGLALVGRYVAAWCTLLTVAVISVAWSTTAGLGPGVGFGLIERHIATLLVGTALAVTLRRSNAAFTAFRALQRRRRAEEQAAEARSSARLSAAESVLQQAGPMLHAIAEGRALTTDERQELLVLEGALRDQIRTPGLTDERLNESLAAARRRGVNVLLLDEAEDAAPAVRARASSWLADELDAATGDRFVGRIRDLEGTVRVSAVVEEHRHAATISTAGAIEE